MNLFEQNLIQVPPHKVPWRVAVADHHKIKCKGGHGTEFAFVGLPGVQIVAMADPDLESRQKLQQETKATNSYENWREMLEREKPDVLCVSSRLPSVHKDMILGAIDAGCHIYCEKPLAVNLRDTDEMINAADAAGVKLAVAHMARYSAAFHHARAMIERGEIGQPLAVICRGKEDGRGGGEDMMVLGTHLLDLACFFFGDPQWVMGRVRCDGRDVTKADAHEATEPMGLVAGDHVIASFGFAHGVDGQFQSRKGLADASEPRMSITIVGSKARLFFQYDSHRQLRIARSDRPMEEGGAFEVVDVKPLPEILEASPIECVAMKDTAMFRYFAKANRYAAVDLLDSIVQDRQPLASGHSARWALEMIHGVYASHLSGRLMNLPLADRDHPLESYRH